MTKYCFTQHGIQWELDFHPGTNTHDDPVELNLKATAIDDPVVAANYIKTLANWIGSNCAVWHMDKRAKGVTCTSIHS